MGFKDCFILLLQMADNPQEAEVWTLASGSYALSGGHNVFQVSILSVYETLSIHEFVNFVYYIFKVLHRVSSRFV